MGLIWIGNLSYWGIVSIWGLTEKYSLYLNYKPFYVKSISNLWWLFLLIGIITFIIKIYLYLRNKRILETMNAQLTNRYWSNINSTSLVRTNVLNNSLNNRQEIRFSFKSIFKLSFTIKMVLITIIYCIQWYLNIYLKLIFFNLTNYLFFYCCCI
jgi:hypothetical protein